MLDVEFGEIGPQIRGSLFSSRQNSKRIETLNLKKAVHVFEGILLA